MDYINECGSDGHWHTEVCPSHGTLLWPEFLSCITRSALGFMWDLAGTTSNDIPGRAM